jgi:Fic family protein
MVSQGNESGKRREPSKKMSCQGEHNMDADKLTNILIEEAEHRIKGGLYHQTQIRFAYNSNRIEGSRLTEEQTRYIFETNTLKYTPDEAANVDDIIETINHFNCFDFMLKHVKEPVSEDMIKEMHRILKRNTSQERLDWFNVGDYKARANMVGDIITTAPGEVSAEMQKLIDEYLRKPRRGIDEITDFHYRFETIHPFQDGNGRVGRMLMFKECLSNGAIPFIIDNRHKMFYYRGLAEYKNEKGFLRDTCLSAQDEYADLAKHFTEKPSMTENPTGPKEKPRAERDKSR